MTGNVMLLFINRIKPSTKSLKKIIHEQYDKSLKNGCVKENVETGIESSLKQFQDDGYRIQLLRSNMYRYI